MKELYLKPQAMLYLLSAADIIASSPEDSEGHDPDVPDIDWDDE